MVKGLSETSGLMPGYAYTWMGLFTTLKIFSISWKKIAKVVFDTVPKLCWNTTNRFYSILDHTEMSWYLFSLVFLRWHNFDIAA